MKNSKLTPHEPTIDQLYEKGWTLQAIATSIGVSRQAVNMNMRARGRPLRQRQESKLPLCWACGKACSTYQRKFCCSACRKEHRRSGGRPRLELTGWKNVAWKHVLEGASFQDAVLLAGVEPSRAKSTAWGLASHLKRRGNVIPPLRQQCRFEGCQNFQQIPRSEFKGAWTCPEH